LCIILSRIPKRAQEEYFVSLSWNRLPRVDALIAAVAHRQFTTSSVDAIGEKIVRGGFLAAVMAAFD
jgi:UDP-N-acetyl-D-glucosamine/UDP-N-acetyl-D-galactosamine dehydrogenase